MSTTLSVGPVRTDQRLPAARSERHHLAASTVVVATALTVLNRIRMQRHLVDLQVYRKGAWAFLHGRNLYGPGLPGPKLPYTYTPFSTVAFAPLELLPQHAAMIAHTFVSLALLYVGIALVLRELEGRGSWTPTILALAAAATFAAYWSEPVSQTLGFGQINLVLMGMVLIDLLALRNSRWCGVLIGIAAGIKLTPLVFVAYLLLTKRRRAAAVAAIAAAGTVVVGWVLMPGPSNRYFFHLVFDDRRIGAPGFVANQSLNGMWTRLMHGYVPARHIWDLSAIVVLTVGLWTARRVHARLGEPHGLAITAVTGLLVSPISWSHHWVWFVVPALILASAAWRARSIALGVVAVAWSLPFYLGPFWHIAHRNYRAIAPVGWQRPLADAYTLTALVALVAIVIWDQAAGRRGLIRDESLPAASGVADIGRRVGSHRSLMPSRASSERPQAARGVRHDHH